ncbi:MAG: glycosyltransferase [Bdellovibrionales bacterium]|nr:glycosyltransferase [Bdellovibrionales bacterium]
MAADSRMSRPWLWIVPKWSFPAQDGARVATVNLLKQVAAQGRVVDYLAIAGDDEKVDLEEARRELGVRRVYVLRRPGFRVTRAGAALGAAQSLVLRPSLPVTLRHFGAPSLSAQVSRLLKEGAGRAGAECTAADGLQTPDWGTVVYDGLHPAAHSRVKGRFIRPSGADGELRVVYRAHNYETGIWERKAAQSGAAMRAFFSAQARLMKEFENSLAGAADAVATVSFEDLSLFRGVNASVRGGVVPIGYSFEEPVPAPWSECPQLMFLGKMDWPPNREGLQWFLREVWPAVAQRRPDLRLAVAGSGESSWLEEFRSLPGLKLLGRVESVESVYRESVLSLVPVFYGSGTRVKAIEACRFGRPCLSTAIGVEGVGLEPGRSYFQAETTAEWISMLSNLDPARCADMGREAWGAARDHFDVVAAARRLLELASS